MCNKSPSIYFTGVKLYDVNQNVFIIQYHGSAMLRKRYGSHTNVKKGIGGSNMPVIKGGHLTIPDIIVEGGSQVSTKNGGPLAMLGGKDNKVAPAESSMAQLEVRKKQMHYTYNDVPFL